MAKSLKKSKEATAQENSSPVPGMESSNGHSKAESAKPAATKKATTKSTPSAKSAGKSRGTSPKKSSAPRKAGAKKTAKRSLEPAVRDEQVRLRAYFISEWRTQNGVPGDSAHDWLEALRQLQAEASRA
ncbi:MAG: DUF2934 domain-containing protein [Chthoniobacterales bacterium]